MEVKLIVTSGRCAGQEIPVTGPQFFIGRGKDCQLRPHSDQVSRRHCVILVEAGRVAVRDLGSRNGTLLNGQRLEAEHDLKMGDHLVVGPLDFEVRLGVPVGGKRKPKVKSIQEAAARTVESAGAAPRDDEEMDVTDWLTDGDEPAMTDTDTLGAAQTERVETEPFAGLLPGEPGSDAAEDKEEEANKGPRKFEPPKKRVADSSREAAADMLREFFKRK